MLIASLIFGSEDTTPSSCGGLQGVGGKDRRGIRIKAGWRGGEEDGGERREREEKGAAW